jgi:hypothetical protein
MDSATETAYAQLHEALQAVAAAAAALGERQAAMLQHNVTVVEVLNTLPQVRGRASPPRGLL